MCARRFLIIVFVLTLIFVAGAFAIFQFGQQVLIKTATPRGHFQAAEAGSGFGGGLASFRQHHDRLVMAERGEQVGDALRGIGKFRLF